MNKTYLSADTFLRDAWRLAAAVRQACWRPDLLIALWRGGAFVGMAVHEYLKTTGWDVRHLPLKCASYTGIGENAGEVVFTLGDELFALIRPGEKVLVVDDVFDTGRTAQAVKARLAAVGAEMRMACVYWKPGRNETTLAPDYFVREVGGDWLVFPHELDGLTRDELLRKDPALAELPVTAADGRGIVV